MLLGRRTFEEMRGWFTDQYPIVLRGSRLSPPVPPGSCVVHSIRRCSGAGAGRGESDLLVAGGAQIYGLALPFADRLILTEVHGSFERGGIFPYDF